MLPKVSGRFFVPEGQVYPAIGTKRARVALFSGAVDQADTGGQADHVFGALNARRLQYGSGQHRHRRRHILQIFSPLTGGHHHLLHGGRRRRLRLGAQTVGRRRQRGERGPTERQFPN